VNTLAGAITAKETSLALAIYCGNHGYLKACCKAGAPRIDLQGGVAGQVTADEATEEDGAAVYQAACQLGCEGIVSKRLGSSYRSGRSKHWIKIKNPKSPAVKREAEEDWGR